MLYVRANVTCARAADLDKNSPHALFVRAALPGFRSPVLLGVVYRHPHLPISDLTPILDNACASGLPLLVGGDFNAHHSSWCHSSDSAGRALDRYCRRADLCILNTVLCAQQSTRWDSDSVLDLFLSSHPQHFSALSPSRELPLSSDHIPLLLHASSPAPFRDSQPPHYRWDIARADWPLFVSLLEDDSERVMAELASLACCTDPPSAVIERMWSSFLDYTLGAAEIAVGRRRVVSASSRRRWHHSVPGAAEASAELHTALRAHVRHPTAASFARLVAARHRLGSMKRGAERQRWWSLCSKISNNNKVRWNSFRATKPTSCIPPSSVAPPGSSLPSSEQEAVNNLAAHFSSTCSPFPHSATSSANEAFIRSYLASIDPCEQHASDAPFTVQEVAAVCKRAKVRSAHGCDDFSPHFLVQGGEPLYAALTVVINYSWQHGVLPLHWRSANIFALFKGKGNDPSLPDSYRPISLTSVVCKVVERLILFRFHRIFSPSPSQAGFRARFSCVDHHHRLQALLQRVPSRGPDRYRTVVFVDLVKAFDKVWHEALMYKLHRAGIRGAMFRWLCAFLTDRRIRVAHRSLYSDWFPVTAGVPQGAVVSPDLFLVFINDLETSIPAPRTHELFLFADDIAVSGMHGGVVGDEQINRALVHIDLWMDRWLMRASKSKTKAVCFTRMRSLPPPPSISFGALGRLDVASSYCYLGLWYEGRQRGRWQVHFDAVIKKVRRACYFIARVIGPEALHSVLVVRTLLLATVIPIITYGFPFWQPTAQQYNLLLSQLALPLRRVLHLPRDTHRLSLLTECGITQLPSLFKHAALAYARRISRLPPDHPSFVLFNDPPPALPLHRLISEVKQEWGLDPTECKRGALARARWQDHMRAWQQDGQCRDLLRLRGPDAAGMAPYIRHDTHPHLRARLRLNRSMLAESRFRRHIVPSSACACGVAVESPAHLLACPQYEAAAHRFLSSPAVAGDASLLLSDLVGISRRRHKHIIELGTRFLLSVRAIRADGI